jgi:3-phenylpropionate/trans-cinnamate dioxygenase ferredoxin reductase subunit
MRRRDTEVERSLWVAIYVVLLLMPLALMAVVVKPGDASLPVIVAGGLGFIGLTILVLQIVTASRVRAFTAPFGIDLLLRFHRQVGVAALVLIVAHIVLLIAADPDKLLLLDPFTAPWRARFGLIAVLAVGGLAVTSLWRAHMGLRYEGWRGLHLALAAIAICAAFAHLIGVSSYLSVQTIRWVVLLFVMIAALALFWLRFGRPYRAGGRVFRVAEVRPERGDAVTLALAPVDHEGLRFEPGQFVWIKDAERPFGLAEHPFSLVSSARRPDALELTIRAAGDFTGAVAELEPGAELLVDGPHGAFRPALPEAGFLLVCGGVGITPAMSILRTLDDDGDRRPVTLVYVSSDWDSVTFREELEELAERISLRVVHVLRNPAPDWVGESGRLDTALLARVLSDDERRRNVLVCGSPAMVEAALEALAELRVPRGQVHAERFAAV